MHCPLCQKVVRENEGCAGCFFAKNCGMIRCPHCGYEFVEKSLIASWLERLFKTLSIGLGRVLSSSSPTVLRTSARGGGAPPSATRLFASGERGFEAGSSVQALSEVDLTGCYEVVSVSLSNRSSINRLAALGLVPGCLLKLHHKFPSLVVRVGETDLALEKKVAEGILVNPSTRSSR